MFSSLLSSQKGPRSERTPLLATLRRYGSRQTGDPSADEDDDVEEDIAQYDGEDEDDEDNGFHGRDGPLLPVFSEFLGINRAFPCLFTLANLSQIDSPSTPRPMRSGS